MPPNEGRTFFEGCGDPPFKYEAGSFELVNARWMAEAAPLAYGDEDFVEARCGEAGLPEVRYFHGRSTQCYAAHNDDFVIVTFSGSDVREREGNDVFDVLTDWMVNLSFDTVPSGRGGRVHRGFAEAHGGGVGGPRGRRGLEDYLDGLCGDGRRRVWFTGHSLGGELATIAAGRYGHAPEVYTFGLGDGKYVEVLDLPAYRFANGGDAVPKLPVGGSHRHAGVEKYTDVEGRIHDGKPGGDGLRAKGGRFMRRIRPSRPSGGALRDHSPVLPPVLRVARSGGPA